MKQTSFWVLWLATFVVMMVIEIIFDLVTGEIAEAFTASRIFWVAVMSLGINLIFYMGQLKKDRQKK
ncbi:hypothetical protein [Polluticoccus soli]|uniref:hypothetical protein n=1 Tax=Polluticoccus soli TaxID=3034150 RepID=UPI0023E34EDA|nr:hypothetical protein [Flavipsychrobacter sp. JY13-12]